MSLAVVMDHFEFHKKVRVNLISTLVRIEVNIVCRLLSAGLRSGSSKLALQIWSLFSLLAFSCYTCTGFFGAVHFQPA